MAIPPWFINLFPASGEVVRQAFLPLLVIGAALVALPVATAWRRHRRVEAAHRQARERGLSPSSARFLAHLLATRAPAAARDLIDSPGLLGHLLARRLTAQPRTASLARFAERAAALLDELRARAPAWPGAPRPFERVVLRSARSDDARVVEGFIVSVDELTLAVVSGDDCPWSPRARLDAHVGDAPGMMVPVALLLRPMPGVREWTLSHELAGHLAHRRSAERVPVRIDSWAVEPADWVSALRDRLRRGDPIEQGRMRRQDEWVNRHHLVIEDLSPDGARLLVDHDVVEGMRFHLVIPADDDTPGAPGGAGPRARIAALPLAEVVNVRAGQGGRLVAGVRFCAMRLKERVVLADLVRRAAARGPGARAAVR